MKNARHNQSPFKRKIAPIAKAAIGSQSPDTPGAAAAAAPVTGDVAAVVNEGTEVVGAATVLGVSVVPGVAAGVKNEL
jgi:hypothetical protein